MSEYKSIKLNSFSRKLALFASVSCLSIIGAIEVSPLMAQNTTKQYLAQTNPETSDPETTVREESNPPATNSIEAAIIDELNRVRTNPQEYANWLESQKQYYQGMLLKLPGEQPIRTNRGLRSLEEAIAFLRQQDALPRLSNSSQLTSVARQQIATVTNNQKIKNRHNLVYGKVTPEAIVMQLVVDDGFPDRRHRLAIFDRNNQGAGIVCSEIPIYNNVCAIAYNAETTEVARQTTTEKPASNNNSQTTTRSETKPEASTTDNALLPTPPDVNSSPIPSRSTESEVIVTTENPAETKTETTESTATTNPETENNPPTASLPQTNTESEVIVTTENPTETETETTESKATTDTETENNPPTASLPQTNTETEEPAEIATTTKTNPVSQAIEIIEKGKLEEGDDVIPNDGSFYDSYPLDGSAGDSFIITLESQDFDTFLAVMDREGNIIEQNDDISEEESNSRLEITLPDNGSYSVIVNAYDRGGEGNYVLKVTR